MLRWVHLARRVNIGSFSAAVASTQAAHYRSYSSLSNNKTSHRNGYSELHRKPTSANNSFQLKRAFSDDASSEDSPMNQPREAMHYDVVIVGGGPAGLSAAIRLKQLSSENGIDLSVCVLEKGSEVGSHILSGNVFDPKALEELLSHNEDGGDKWTEALFESQDSHATPVSEDAFLVLTESGGSYQIPNMLLPSQLHNDGNYIISLSKLARYLGEMAEGLGVEIYPGFAADEVIYSDDQTSVRGVATKDMGIGKEGEAKDTFERGVELLGRQTLFAEGARGSCSELSVTDKVYGGSFLYHQEPNLVLCGLVVGLDYENPYLNPYKEFQRWKTHPAIKSHLEGGTCIQYGARVLNEGGYHSLPKLTFPGGMLLGCSAGFLNAVKIKGSHCAIQSGAIAAESVYNSLASGEDAEEKTVASTGEIDSEETPVEVTQYAESMEKSWVYDELKEVRNCHEAFSRWGVGGGLIYTGIAAHITKGKEPWTLPTPVGNNAGESKTDSKATKPAKDFQPIDYPAPDGIMTFDLLTNLQRSGTYHDDDQPSHLRIKPELAHIPESTSLQVYAAPESRFCPAAIYSLTKLGTIYPLPTNGICDAITVMFKTFAPKGKLAMAKTVLAASSTENVGSGITVPFACGMPDDMLNFEPPTAFVISEETFPKSICPQATLNALPSKAILFVNPRTACFDAV
ncbi:electron transfer flavoprotein-ubiquinone oxidoreductase [Skeletonema marinoi]|uniref:Electron transfer flavoprotein-ubiquinone oxidoreductase n=1 Tax=Skeletonema marinoi TaxID=267567 RepID=A0AAD8XZ13_9STRA|nr:electron transfer flavoprotein-ubiquinone oxidoreductase [Skeletonema marinoi]